MYLALCLQLSFTCGKLKLTKVCQMTVGLATYIHCYRGRHVVSCIRRMRENTESKDLNGGQYTAPNKDGRRISYGLIYLLNLGWGLSCVYSIHTTCPAVGRMSMRAPRVRPDVSISRNSVV